VKGVSHVFNFDTPWHPDDYVHRVGRTGRAGATGRAFTLIAPEDKEAIENVEKLTGSKLPVFEVGKGASSDQPARAEPTERAEQAERKPRERQPARAERAPREERAEKPRSDRPRRDGTKPPKAARHNEADEADEAGVWNGPVPSFLGVSAL
jgi:superfamily II DNA/RNA helicase